MCGGSGKSDPTCLLESKEEAVMRDYLPPIHIRVRGEHRQFLNRMADLADKSGDFVVERKYDAMGKEGFDVVNLRLKKSSLHTGLGGQLIAQPRNETSVAVEIRAQRWAPEDPPTYEVYCAEAKALITPLLRAYNREAGTRYRLSIPSQVKLEPKLPPQCMKLFKRFTALANKSALHPLDWRRFYEFVRNCKSRTCYSEDEIMRLLVKEGFSKKHARYIGDVYVHLWNFKRLT